MWGIYEAYTKIYNKDEVSKMAKDTGTTPKIDKMSKAEIMKVYGPKIKSQFGEDEYKFIKGDATGPGGVDRLRSYVRDYFFNRGGMVKKKKMAKGGALKKAPAGNKGLKKLPTSVRNKMGYMKKGGYAKKK